MKYLRAIVAAATVMGVGVTAARAETASDSIGVSATMVKECTTNTSSAAASFGNTKGLTELSKDIGSTTLGITCTNGTTYTVQLDSANKSLTQFRMKNGTNYLKYGIFSGAGGVNAVSPATNITDAAGTGNGQEQATSLFFRLQETDSNLPLGAYSDALTVTVTY